MLELVRTTAATAVVAGMLIGATPVQANRIVDQPAQTQNVDVVIALDVSGSMSGLIESAKQRLWDIVNELGRAQPQPNLRLAILTYGRPAYGADTGYVRIDLPFTRDLDAVNKTLFSFSTDGGDEYVARAVSTSVHDLDWSDDPNALRIIFVAGNEAATQDPQISLLQATRAAASAGIVVNTIYCGSENDAIVAGWRDSAVNTNGLFASINQDAAAVANIATPMDTKLAELNRALNDTYIMYGAAGEGARENQLQQDANAGAMSQAAMASRVVTKAGRLYDASEWDLVDAVESGKNLEEMEPENLPAAMRDMDKDERAAFVGEQAEKRQTIQAEIAELDDARRAFIQDERARQAADEDGLDEAMLKGLRTLAEAKGFTFD